MATDPNRQSDGRPRGAQGRTLNRTPGIHLAFQIAWAVAIAIPSVTAARQLAHRPTAGAALTIVELTAAWALIAGLAWGLRAIALTGCRRFGARTRQRVREAGRRARGLR